MEIAVPALTLSCLILFGVIAMDQRLLHKYREQIRNNESEREP